MRREIHDPDVNAHQAVTLRRMLHVQSIPGSRRIGATYTHYGSKREQRKRLRNY